MYGVWSTWIHIFIFSFLFCSSIQCSSCLWLAFWLLCFSCYCYSYSKCYNKTTKTFPYIFQMRWGIRIWNFIAVFSFDLNDGKLGSLFHITENKSLSVARNHWVIVCVACFPSFISNRSAIQFRFIFFFISLCVSINRVYVEHIRVKVSIEHMHEETNRKQYEVFRYCYISFILTIVTRWWFKYPENFTITVTNMFRIKIAKQKPIQHLQQQ